MLFTLVEDVVYEFVIYIVYRVFTGTSLENLAQYDFGVVASSIKFSLEFVEINDRLVRCPVH